VHNFAQASPNREPSDTSGKPHNGSSPSGIGFVSQSLERNSKKLEIVNKFAQVDEAQDRAIQEG
jgi:hypothetical protein